MDNRIYTEYQEPLDFVGNEYDNPWLYEDDDDLLPFDSITDNYHYIFVTGLQDCVVSIAAKAPRGKSATYSDDWPWDEVARELAKKNGTILIYTYLEDEVIDCDHYYIDRYGDEQYQRLDVDSPI